MYEKAPETINVTFPVISGVIADFNNLQTMLQMYLEEHMKGKIRGAEFIVAVPTDITDVEKRAFFEMFYKSKLKPKSVLLCEKPIADAVGMDWMSMSRPVSWLWTSAQIQQKFLSSPSADWY